jgi:hypothetical protein
MIIVCVNISINTATIFISTFFILIAQFSSRLYQSELSSPKKMQNWQRLRNGEHHSVRHLHLLQLMPLWPGNEQQLQRNSKQKRCTAPLKNFWLQKLLPQKPLLQLNFFKKSEHLLLRASGS